MSVRLTVSEVRPIFMIRLVADRAGIMNGGLAQVGRVAVIWESRSATSWRARSSSVSREKNSWIEDSWATDLDRRSSKPSIPFSWFSIGTVISSSTSLEEFPRAMVWISTRGGANSGNTSTLVSGIWTKPTARWRRRGTARSSGTSGWSRRCAASRCDVRWRISRSDLRWQASRCDLRSGASVLTCHSQLGAVDLSYALSHDLGARRWAVGQRDPVAVDFGHSHLRPHVGQRLRGGVDPGFALLVVDQRRVLDH